MERTHPMRLLAGLATLVASATPANSAIFHQDDRQYVSSGQGSPYSPIGVVTRGVLIYSFATGFLVDDCHVLTSQVILGYGSSPLGKRVSFQTAPRTQQSTLTKGTVVAAGGIVRNRTAEKQYQRGGHNWMLVRLDRCLGARLGHVTLKTGPFSPYEFGGLKSAGYPEHRRRSNGLTVDPSCRITGSRGTVWTNDCATVKGDAGDPIFRVATSSGKPQLEVYAMQSAGFTPAKAIPLIAGYENQAVPMALIAKQIEPYLSLTKQSGGDGVAAPLAGNALPQIGGSPDGALDGVVLGSGLAASNDRPNSESRAD